MLDIIIFAAGIYDYKYRRISNIIVLAMGVYALLFSGASVYERLAGFLATAMPLFILAIATGKIKGGDVKYLSVCAGALGITVFIKTLIFTTIAAIIWSVVKKEKSVPLASVFVIGYWFYSILWF